MQERRKYARSQVLKSAKLLLGTSSMVDCVVHDLTNRGARIEATNPDALPRSLDMTFDGGRSLRPCRLVWRTSNEVGVEFSKCAGKQST